MNLILFLLLTYLIFDGNNDINLKYVIVHDKRFNPTHLLKKVDSYYENFKVFVKISYLPYIKGNTSRHFVKHTNS